QFNKIMIAVRLDCDEKVSENYFDFICLYGVSKVIGVNTGDNHFAKIKKSFRHTYKLWVMVVNLMARDLRLSFRGLRVIFQARFLAFSAKVSSLFLASYLRYCW